MVHYPQQFEVRGPQIGTGATESMCKAIPRRAEGMGMRWDWDHAQAVMALEALEQSHQKVTMLGNLITHPELTQAVRIARPIRGNRVVGATSKPAEAVR